MKHLAKLHTHICKQICKDTKNAKLHQNSHKNNTKVQNKHNIEKKVFYLLYYRISVTRIHTSCVGSVSVTIV